MIDKLPPRERQVFDLAIDWRRSKGFRLRVLHALAEVPFGVTVSYGELARRIQMHEDKLRHGLESEAARRMIADYLDASGRLERERGALRAVEADPFAVDLAIQELRSRARYVEQLSHPMGKQGAQVRDAGMADNLDFLLDVMYPGRKVIVWAHNGHVGRHPAGSARERWMGSLVAERRRGEVYTIGLYMGWGIGAHNDRRRYDAAATAREARTPRGRAA